MGNDPVSQQNIAVSLTVDGLKFEITRLQNQLAEKEAECERLYERIKRLEEKVMFYRKHSYINKVILKKPEGEVKG